jgi:cell shape-determining protein MreD
LLFTIAHALAIVIAAALQRAWPEPLRVGVVSPNLVLVLVACIGITRGPVAGCASGLFGGFLAGAVGGDGAYGSLIISHMVVGFLAGQARGRLFVDHMIAAPVVALLATVLGTLIQFVGSPPSQFSPWIGESGIEALYNILVSPLAYLYARAVNLRWPLNTEA